MGSPLYPVPAFIRGTTAFLIKQIDRSLDAMNSDLVASVVSSRRPPSFVSAIGDSPSASESRICVSYKQFGETRLASEGSREIAFTFELKCLIPTLSDNTTMQFEMARQVSAEHTLNWLIDDAVTLRPWITVGNIADPFGLMDDNNRIRAKDCSRGRMMDIYGLLMADGKTRPRGWAVNFTLNFSIKQA